MSDTIESSAGSKALLVFEKAEDLLLKKRQDEAEALYMELLKDSNTGPIANFRLGEIKNRNGDAKEAYEYHKNAFQADAKLASRVLAKESLNYKYIYEATDEIPISHCPLCGAEGKLHSAYNMISNADYIKEFNPIRIWKICEKCNHIFAGGYPRGLSEIISNSPQELYINSNTNLLPLACDVLSNINKVTSGKRLLDVGVGGGEMVAVAKEMLFDVTGVEIRYNYAEHVSKRFDVPIYCMDFMEFETDELFDIVILGDVIEHLLDPVKMLQKASSLLNKQGILWISTPNFKSAYSNIMKDKDPMWKVCEHLNYFSYESLNKLLGNLGFKVMDYKVSRHYNGSMEIIAKRLELN